MKLSRKFIATLSAGALAFALLGMAGCSSEEEATNTELTTADINAQEIEVTQTGFEVFGENVSYAFTVNNPNDGYMANGVTFTIEGYDEDGTMVMGGGETLQMIYPGIETACAGQSYLAPESGTVTRFEVRPLMDNVTWTKTDVTAEELESKFEVSDVEVSESDGTTVVNGTISSDLGVDSNSDADALANAREDVHLVVLFKDADGKIICGGSSMGIMLDPSMTSVMGTPISPDEAADGTGEGGTPIDEATEDVELDENGQPVASDPAAAEVDEPVPAEVVPSTVAKTTFYVTIPGIFDYASYQIIATPGM